MFVKLEFIKIKWFMFFVVLELDVIVMDVFVFFKVRILLILLLVIVIMWLLFFIVFINSFFWWGFICLKIVYLLVILIIFLFDMFFSEI